MADNMALIRSSSAKLKRGFLLWFEGFKEACCLHRVVMLCYKSRSLLIRTGQCFLLNGLIFLGSVFILKSFVIPVLQWILPDYCPHVSFQEICASSSILKIYSALRAVLIQLLHLCWFYPLYAFSIVLSAIWYNDIAKHGFVAMGKYKPAVAESLVQKVPSASKDAEYEDKPAGIGGVMIGIGEQVYSVLLLSCFFLEVYATGFIPYVGRAINFLLISWMYAYYCFEYKWNLSEVSLDRRLDFFESNWAFFAGFGNPCVLAIFCFPPLESYAVMATLFPLFVLTATGSEADHLISSKRKNWRGAGLGRLPIFYVADMLSMRVLSFLPLGSLHEQEQGNKVL
ncbi:hypothetical protein Nepgr_025774 [Nepenthes gracilis]|uniref:Protein EI24 homolog n=1 Tax=Nepenthes gracilis TaxID=150966 RepID=A0AAD3T8H9_NEPGR|nr:hypothetical protein Nepgr_025774 [Nepenthes gracilis]